MNQVWMHAMHDPDHQSTNREAIPQNWLDGDQAHQGVDDRSFAQYCQDQQGHRY
jgi:hypothetical protein